MGQALSPANVFWGSFPSSVKHPMPPAAGPIHQDSQGIPCRALQLPVMVKGIEHTAIASPEPERLAQWYVEHLGFTINYQSKNSRTVFVKAADGSMIEMIEAARPAAGVSRMNDPGLRHLALTVEDFDAAYRRLKDRGIPFLTEVVKKAGNSTVFFTDPDGNILHLLHRDTPLP